MEVSLKRVGSPGPQSTGTSWGTQQVVGPPGGFIQAYAGPPGWRAAQRHFAWVRNELDAGDVPGTSLGGERPAEMPRGQDRVTRLQF